MSAKIASAALCLVFGVQAILAQSTCGCGNSGLTTNGLGYNGLSNNGLGYNGLGCNGLGYNGLSNNGLSGLNVAAGAGSYAGYGVGSTGVASTGGGLVISSVSPIAPLGLSVLSDVSYGGQLAANGNLPFLGTVSVEGTLGTAGVGAVTYGCGNGNVGISAETPIATGIGSSLGSNGLNQAIGPNYASGLGGIAGYGLSGISGYGLGGISGYGLGGISGYGASGCGC